MHLDGIRRRITEDERKRDFSDSTTKKIQKKEKGITKRELETRSDRQGEREENKGAGERRGAEWRRRLGGGAHSNEQVVGGREG